MNKNAFTIIELIIYMGIFSFFSLIAFGFLTKAQKSIISQIGENEKLIKNTIALDLLKRDLLSASNKVDDWDFQNLVFNKNYLDGKGNPCSICVGWKNDKDGLSRITGNYDFKLHKWNKRVVSRVNNLITNFDLKIQKNKDGFVQGVELFIADNFEFVGLKI